MLQNRKKFYVIVFLLPLVMLLTCIERNNPWDPINGCPDEVKADYRRALSPKIDAQLNDVSLLIKKIDSLQTGFSSNEQLVMGIETKNDSLKRIQVQDSSFNDSIYLANVNTDVNTDCKKLALKRFYPILDSIQIIVPDDIGKIRGDFWADSLRIVSIIASGNDSCLPMGIYTHKQIDSIEQPLLLFGPKVEQLISRYKNDSLSYVEKNTQVRSNNLLQLSRNQLIGAYNDSISDFKSTCGIDPITNPDTLFQRFTKLKPGDTLYLGAGQFVRHLTLQNIGNLFNPIVIIGSPNMETVLDSVDISVSNCKNIQFKNLIFQNSMRSSGVLVLDRSISISFKNCIFRNNFYYGIDGENGSYELENCQVYDNEAGGIKIHGDGSIGLTLMTNNVLICHNKKNGVDIGAATVYINNTTVSDNEGDGVQFFNFIGQGNFYNSILSFNGQNGLNRLKYNRDKDDIFSYCDFFENAKKDIVADSVYLEINGLATYMNENPCFEDRSQNNYRILPSSKMYDLNIGYQYKR